MHPQWIKYHFNGKEDTKKFFYISENVGMKKNAEDKKADSLVAYLEGEAFECYFQNFTEDNAPNEDSRSFQIMKAALFGNFSTKNTEAKVMKEAVKLVCKWVNVKEFFIKASTLYKEAKFNDGVKFGLIREAIKTGRGMFQFLFSRKAGTCEKFKETGL